MRINPPFSALLLIGLVSVAGMLALQFWLRLGSNIEFALSAFLLLVGGVSLIYAFRVADE